VFSPANFAAHEIWYQAAKHFPALLASHTSISGKMSALLMFIAKRKRRLKFKLQTPFI